MPKADFVKDLSGWAGTPANYVVNSLTYTLVRVCQGGEVEQALVPLGILRNRSDLASYRKYNRALGFSEPLNKVARPASKAGDGLNVFGQIRHSSLMVSTSSIRC